MWPYLLILQARPYIPTCVGNIYLSGSRALPPTVHQTISRIAGTLLEKGMSKPLYHYSLLERGVAIL